MSKAISIADYLHRELDKKRLPRESWTAFFCRSFSIEYLPHGITRPHRRGRVPQFLKVVKNV